MEEGKLLNEIVLTPSASSYKISQLSKPGFPQKQSLSQASIPGAGRRQSGGEEGEPTKDALASWRLRCCCYGSLAGGSSEEPEEKSQDQLSESRGAPLAACIRAQGPPCSVNFLPLRGAPV